MYPLTIQNTIREIARKQIMVSEAIATNVTKPEVKDIVINKTIQVNVKFVLENQKFHPERNIKVGDPFNCSPHSSFQRFLIFIKRNYCYKMYCISL